MCICTRLRYLSYFSNKADMFYVRIINYQLQMNNFRSPKNHIKFPKSPLTCFNVYITKLPNRMCFILFTFQNVLKTYFLLQCFDKASCSSFMLYHYLLSLNIFIKGLHSSKYTKRSLIYVLMKFHFICLFSH
jgi:hypothetical protein